MNITDRLTAYVNSSYLELKKVIWPSKKELVQHTLMVIGVSLGVAAFLGIIDFILNIALSSFIK